MTDRMLQTINRHPNGVEGLDPATRDELMLDLMAVAPRARRTRRRTLVAAAVGGTLLVLGAGTAVALTMHSPRSESLTYCSLPGTQDVVDVAGPTGDPVQNCAIAWQKATGQDAPPLIAYQEQHGRVEVYPASQPAPEGAVRLTPGTQQDPELIALDEALGDYVNGLAATCLNGTSAKTKAEQVVAHAGVSGWAVVDRTSGDVYPEGTTLCIQAAANPTDHAVHLNAVPDDAAARARVEPIAERLRASLTECWSMQTALSRVQAAIAASGYSESDQTGFPIREVATADARCTTVHLNGGGTLSFTLRGPA